MAGLNKAMVLGNVGRDPETRAMPSGATVTTLSIATSYSWKDKESGEKKEETEWHRCVAFGRAAEVLAQYVKKGERLFVEGRLKTRKWEKDGQDHYSTEIVVENFQLLGDRRGGGEEGSEKPAARRPAAAPAAKQGGFSDMDNDIPF